ncbi:MAG: YetF domain-containing protein [Bacillota bacterium]|jgi:uncharacterized membrane protein YcaP (DUF421 family)
MDIILRTLGILFFTLVCFRIMGYRSLGDVEPLDFVIVLGIAEILGSSLADKNLNIWNSLIAIGTLTILQILLSYASLKSNVVLNLLEGTPIPVIKNGKILRRNLRKARFSYHDLLEELRIQGLQTIHDVELANLEPSGRFSVIRKKESKSMETQKRSGENTVIIIEKGQVCTEKLKQAGLTYSRLLNILSELHITDIKQIERALFFPEGHIALIIKNPF